MARLSQATTGLLVAAMLAGCGTSGAPSAPASLVQGSAVRAMAVHDGQARSLITAYQKVSGSDAAAMTERVRLIGLLAKTDSDRAVDFLLGEAAKLEAMSDAAYDLMEPALEAAMTQLDTYDEARDEAILAGGVSESVEGQANYEMAAARKHRRFNIWDGARKYFKKRKRKSSGGGGGNTPPAPPPAPAGGDIPQPA